MSGGDIRARAAQMVARFLVTLVDDAGPVQRLQGEALAGEVLDRAERMTDYGFSSHPLPGAEGVLIAVAGSRGQGVVLAVGDRRWRLMLDKGEVAIHDDLGQVVHLTRDGIRVVSPIRVEIEAPEVGLSATTEITLAAPKIVLASDNVRLGADSGARAVARHDDAVVAGKVVATSVKVRSA